MSWKRNYIFFFTTCFLLIVLGLILVLYRGDFTFKKPIFLLDSRDPIWQSDNLTSKNIAGVSTSDIFTDQTKWCSVELNQEIAESEDLYRRL